MVLLGSAQCTRASGTQAKERVGFVVIIQLNRSALLQAALTILWPEVCAQSTVHTESAPLKGVILVFTVMVSAASTVPN